MKKVTQMVLMLFLVLSGAWCYASGAARTGNEKGNDGMPISVIKKAGHSSPEKGMAIHASIDGHYLAVVFTENLGSVSVEITTANGGYVQTDSCLTPNGLQFYIPNTGDYIVNFTLPNGDEYYGEFTVTN